MSDRSEPCPGPATSRLSSKASVRAWRRLVAHPRAERMPTGVGGTRRGVVTLGGCAVLWQIRCHEPPGRAWHPRASTACWGQWAGPTPSPTLRFKRMPTTSLTLQAPSQVSPPAVLAVRSPCTSPCWRADVSAWRRRQGVRAAQCVHGAAQPVRRRCGTTGRARCAAGHAQQLVRGPAHPRVECGYQRVRVPTAAVSTVVVALDPPARRTYSCVTLRYLAI